MIWFWCSKKCSYNYIAAKPIFVFNIVIPEFLFEEEGFNNIDKFFRSIDRNTIWIRRVYRWEKPRRTPMGTRRGVVRSSEGPTV